MEVMTLFTKGGRTLKFIKNLERIIIHYMNCLFEYHQVYCEISKKNRHIYIYIYIYEALLSTVFLITEIFAMIFIGFIELDIQ